MKIKITGDSTLDLSPELYEKHKIDVLPFVVVLGEESFFDGQNISPQQIFDYVKRTGELPHTGARSPEDLAQFFKKYTDQGFEVVHIGIGSKLSSGYEYSCKAAENNASVHVVDTASLSSGSGLLAIYASELAQTGKYTAKQVAEMVGERAKHVQASFIVEKVKYLYKGGRCSALAMIGANLLGIKPCLQLEDGKIVVRKKYLGTMVGCLKKYMKETLELYSNPDHTRVMITFPSATPQMLEAAKSVVEQYGKFKEVHFTTASSVIACHCGENTIGILYINDGDEGHY